MSCGRSTWMHVYGQDDWRVSPNLTINYGLRYEINSQMADINMGADRALARLVGVLEAAMCRRLQESDEGRRTNHAHAGITEGLRGIAICRGHAVRSPQARRQRLHGSGSRAPASARWRSSDLRILPLAVTGNCWTT